MISWSWSPKGQTNADKLEALYRPFVSVLKGDAHSNEKGPRRRGRRSPIGSLRLSCRRGGFSAGHAAGQSGHPVHHQVIEEDGRGACERSGDAQLKIAGDGGELSSDAWNMGKGRAHDRQRNDTHSG